MTIEGPPVSGASQKRPKRTAGIVLCGGRSSRMGRPKAWLPFGNELMLQRVVRVLCEVVDPMVVVAAPGQEVPPLPPEVAIVRDEIEGKGPLGGLAAGLAALEGRVEAAYLSSCDVPFLMPGFVQRVVEVLKRPNPPSTLPKREGGKKRVVCRLTSPFLALAITSIRSRPFTVRRCCRTSVNCSPPTAYVRCSCLMPLRPASSNRTNLSTLIRSSPRFGI